LIIETHSDREYEDSLALLQVINILRDRGPDYYPPVTDDTPWVRTRWASPQYL
jgi:hypothetical protein